MQSAITPPTGHGDVSRAVVFDSGAGTEVSNRQVRRDRRYLTAAACYVSLDERRRLKAFWDDITDNAENLVPW